MLLQLGVAYVGVVELGVNDRMLLVAVYRREDGESYAEELYSNGGRTR